jgi:diguanylate cyclase
LKNSVVPYSNLLWWDPQDLFRARHYPGTLRILGLWLAVCAVSVVTGLLTVTWNAFPVSFGPLTLNASIYPPLALCVLLTLWLGPFWGTVPAYLTSLVLVVHNGMPLATGAVFSLSTPITLTVLWSSMVMLEVSPSLRKWNDMARFALLSLVAAGASSVGALVWNVHHGLKFSQAQAVWRGWVIGDFLQIILIVGPLLYWFHRPVQRWLTTRVSIEPRRSLSTRFSIAVFLLVFAVMIAVGAEAGKLFLSTLFSAERGQIITPSLLRNTLGEAAFFIGIYAFLFLASVIVFSFAIGSQMERHVRDIAERKRVQEERENLITQLQEALARVKQLSGMLPICARCKKIRDDKGYWSQIEVYIRDRSEAEFSHGICPECAKQLYPQVYNKIQSDVEGSSN